MDQSVTPSLDGYAVDKSCWQLLRIMIQSDQVPYPRLWELFKKHPKFAAWYVTEETRWRAEHEEEQRRQVEYVEQLKKAAQWRLWPAEEATPPRGDNVIQFPGARK